ncbi:MAG: ATP-binding cassette domain-containing protein [Blautia sp.]|nr:ATP-binding cassette domain-containing protein [Blautia sp.]
MTISMEDITQSYDGKVVVDHFNLDIEDRKSYALVGPAGCGKTTILKIFMGQIRPTGGAVHRMGDYKYPTLQSGYVSQEGQLNEKKNAIWNVKKVYRRTSKEMVAEELHRFLPEERLTLPVSELTPGERKLVEIVRAFTIPADFLVMDEPFEGLSEESIRKVIAYIQEKQGSRSLLMASRTEDHLDFARIIHLK